MSTLVSEVRAVKVWFDDDNIWLDLEDGLQVSAPLAFYPGLLNATKEQRENYEFIGPGIGVHWEDLDEDLSVEGIVLGRKDRTSKADELDFFGGQTMASTGLAFPARSV